MMNGDQFYKPTKSLFLTASVAHRIISMFFLWQWLANPLSSQIWKSGGAIAPLPPYSTALALFLESFDYMLSSLSFHASYSKLMKHWLHLMEQMD